MYSFNKVYEILNFEKEEDILINKKDLQFKSKIEFLNLDFKYPNSNFKIFENVNLNINKGDKIGIFGESGSGKSTFSRSYLWFF